jgi:CRP/FNR family transcriptional regulator, cyclic AMP receptor protein
MLTDNYMLVICNWCNLIPKLYGMTVDKQMLLLRNCNLWAHLTNEEFEELNVVHNFVKAPKGNYIYFDSHFLNKLYFLKDGYIKIGYIDETGREVVKEIIQKGEVFGQFTLDKNNMNGEFAQAYKADVSLCAFNIEDFEKILKQKPAIALQFTRQVGHKLRHIENRLINLLHKDVRTRLLHFFMMLAGVQNENNIKIEIENFLTHEDIANLVGASRQTVTTVLGELATENLVTVQRQVIILPDVKRLQKLLSVM